jgi:hypothetical protein
MRRLSLALLVLALPLPAAAQDAAAVAAVRTLSACVTEHETHLTRLVRLIDEAQARTSSSDEAVRRDAVESVTTLVGRAHDVREHLRECIESARLPRVAETTVVERTTTADSAADSVASSGGSIHEVEADESLGTHVRVVRGERVDGSGTASDEAVRSAVHGLATSFATCYDAYVDRVGTRRGSVHLSFTATEGGRVSPATVERAGFDAPMRQCIQRAAQTMHVAGAHGRSVFAYELSFE